MCNPLTRESVLFPDAHAQQYIDEIAFTVILYFGFFCYRKVGLLEISGKQFRIKEIDLKTVRQFYIENVVLSDTSLNSHEDEKVYNYLTEKVTIQKLLFLQFLLILKLQPCETSYASLFTEFNNQATVHVVSRTYESNDITERLLAQPQFC